MDNSRKKKILFLAGSTYIFIIGSLLVLISLIVAIILFNYQDGDSASSSQQVTRKRPELITFDDQTPTPAAEAISEQTTEPVAEATASEISAQTDPSPTPVSNNSTTDLSTPTPTVTKALTPLASATLTPTPTPTFTPTPTPTYTPTPTSTPTSTPSVTPVPGSIAGRVLLNGVPEGGVTIKLEDQAINTVAQTVSGADGTYTFANLTATDEGYNLVFAQEWNTQYALDQVISWGWLGSIPVADGNVVQMPDFDISLLGFEPTTPAANASFSAISSSNPIQFTWVPYPQANRYWVDLAHGQDQNIVWQSSIAQSTSISFDGILANGSQIQPGEYWWGVGARRDLGAYKLTVYGYLPVFLVVP